MLDIRIPIGLMFTVIGAILLVYGLVPNKEMYETHSMGLWWGWLNINIAWGGLMLVFGAIMLLLARWRRQN